MMAGKALLFGDNNIFEEIMNENNPKIIKNLGRKVKNFDENIWKENCLDIVTIGNYLKFKQNPKLQKELLETGDNILAEASPYDKIWGIGLYPNDIKCNDPKEWKGKNLLGRCLMTVRKIIREENNIPN